MSIAVALGHCHEMRDLGKGQRCSAFLAYPKYRWGANGWEETKMEFVHDGSAGVLGGGSVHTLTVGNDGQLALDHRFEGRSHDWSMYLSAVGLLRGDGTFDEIKAAQPGPPSQAPKNRLHWSNYFDQIDGIDLDVVYLANQVRTVVTIRDVARPGLLACRRQNSRLAFLWGVDFSGLGHKLWSRPGRPLRWMEGDGAEVPRILFARNGRVKMRLPAGCVRLGERGRALARRRLLLRRRGPHTQLIEIVPWETLETAPPGPLVMNATATYREGVDGYCGCGDALCDSGLPDENWGWFSSLPIGNWGDPPPPNAEHMVIRWNEIPYLGTLSAVEVKLWRLDNGEAFKDSGVTAKISVYDLTRYWFEDGVTWNTYDGNNPWTTPGGDRGPTSFCNIDNFEVEDTTNPWVMDFNEDGVTHVEENWLGADNNGIQIYCHKTGTGEWYQPVCTSQFVEEDMLPQLTLTYTPPPTSGDVVCTMRHRKYLGNKEMPYEIS